MDPAEWFFLGFWVGALLIIGLWVSPSWRQAFFSGAPVPFRTIIAMRLRGTPPAVIIAAHVALTKRGRTIPLDVVEVVYLANRRQRLEASDLADLVERRVPGTGSAGAA